MPRSETPPARTLTIGQLAAHVGVTVRAVRHYHRSGLLPEPARDASGYRRYGAQAVVDLIRIRTLAEAGVPLARVGHLVGATPDEFRAAVAAVDRTLHARIRQLQRHRRRLAELVEGDRLFLPTDIVDILEQLRAMGVSEAGVQIERDAWILGVSLMPEHVREWADQKRAALADDSFRRLYLRCDEARTWDASDQRLAELAEALVEYGAQHRALGVDPPDWTVEEPSVVSLVSAQVADASPAWARLWDLGQQRLEELGPPRSPRPGRRTRS